MKEKIKPGDTVTHTVTAEETGDYLLVHEVDLDGYYAHLIGPDGEDRGRVTGLVVRPGQTVADALRDATPPGCNIVAKRG